MPQSNRYPLPPNEAERLAEIFGYDFADGGPADNLDAIARVAQRAFDVPIALVTLLGADEQRFLAHCGTDETGTAREDAFCAYTILGDEVFTVPDASADERFVDNPLVTGPMHVRFYAGAPLMLRPGVRVGSLCLLDTRPRSFSNEDEALLQAMAQVAANELLHRRTVVDLRREQELLAQAAMIGKIGNWAVDVAADVLHLSPESCRILDVREDETLHLNELAQRVAASERERVGPAVRNLLVNGTPFDDVVTLRRADGTECLVRCVAAVETATDGRAVRFAGSLQRVNGRAAG